MYGIAHLNLVQVRAEPDSKSELTTQLLFGETYKVLEQKGDWIFIETIFDNYTGWINFNQFSSIKNIKPTFNISTVFPYRLIEFQNKPVYVLPGSQLSEDYESDAFIKYEALTDFAKKFIGAPYLWGGRSFWGIDCSGFVQVVFKCCGINLPRDAYQQATLGSTIDFISLAEPNDVAFFENEEGKIIHTGILLNSDEIIHASGSVRVDAFDSFGIFNKELNKHTHRLKVVKRFV